MSGFGVEPLQLGCPYCGESITVLVDPSTAADPISGTAQQMGLEYIEDCQVCCRPIRISVHLGEDGMLQVQGFDENDV